MAATSRYLTPIKKGEYDLVNISIIGHDPTTGRSLEECHTEWRAELDKLIEEIKTIRWWQLRRRWNWGTRYGALRSHYGM